MLRHRRLGTTAARIDNAFHEKASMLQAGCASTAAPRYEIRFCSLFKEGRALAFPCDAQGWVELDTLSDRARYNYLYARALIGHDYATPALRVSDDLH